MQLSKTKYLKYSETTAAEFQLVLNCELRKAWQRADCFMFAKPC